MCQYCRTRNPKEPKALVHKLKLFIEIIVFKDTKLIRIKILRFFFYARQNNSNSKSSNFKNPNTFVCLFYLSTKRYVLQHIISIIDSLLMGPLLLDLRIEVLTVHGCNQTRCF